MIDLFDVTAKHCFCSYHPVEKYGKRNEKQAKKNLRAVLYEIVSLSLDQNRPYGSPILFKKCVLYALCFTFKYTVRIFDTIRNTDKSMHVLL
jgi:hypothetical protein